MWASPSATALLTVPLIGAVYLYPDSRRGTVVAQGQGRYPDERSKSGPLHDTTLSRA